MYSTNVAAVANIITRYQTSGVVVASSGNTIVTFDTANNTYSVGATGITYSAGTFTNSNSSTVTMSVVYTVVFPYNNTGTRAAWVQDNNGVVSGYTDTQSVTSNSGYTTLTATSIITLTSNGTFVIYAQSPGTALTTITGLGGSSIQVQTLNGGYAATQTNILARYLDNSQSISNNSNTVVLYDTTDSTNNIGSLPLSYSAGTFTNTGSSPISIDITYTVSYNAATANAAVYEGWISSSSQNYGYTSQSTTWPASLTGSAQITIAVNGTFTITTYQNSGNTQTLNSGNRYTSIQISALTAGASGGTINATTTSNTLGSLFTTTSGNIGIGTSSPTSVLQVSNSSNRGTNGALFVTGGDSYGHSLYIGGANESKRIAFSHSGNMGHIFCYDYTILSAQHLSLQAYGGNLGVGTTSPSYTLDVNGTGRFTDTLNVSGNISSASTISGNVFTGSSLQISGSTSTGTLVASTIVLGNTSVQNTTGNININFKLKNVNGTTSATTPNLQFYQNSMLIESSTIYTGSLWSNAGRSVHYGSDIIIKSGDVIDGSNNGDGVVDLYGGNVIIQAGIGNCESRDGGSGGTAARGYNGKISFKVGEGILSSGSLSTTEVMAILAGGNVGIGISTPSYKLDVNGAGRFTGTLLATNNSNTLGSLITTGGNVGVGTTSPAYKLDVNGTGRFTRLANDEAAAVGYVLGSSQSMPGSSAYTISLTDNNDSSVTTTYGSSVFGLSSGTNITNTSGRIITVIVNYNLRIPGNINYKINITLSTTGTEYGIMNPQGISLSNMCGSAIITMPVGSNISFGGYNYSGTTTIQAGSNFQVALLN